MKVFNIVRGAALLLLAAVMGCAHVTNDNQALCTDGCKYDNSGGYRYHPSKNSDTLIVVTFSGGGLKAATLAYGTLRALKALPSPRRPGKTLLDDVNVISSVSGGSLTAGWYALNGRDGIGTEGGNRLETLIRQGATSEIVARGLNPATLARYAFTPYQRSDVLAEVFADAMYDDKTYADVAKLYDKDDQAFVILNATDLGHETRFPFTQNRFDLICSDLSKYRVAYGVAASANFPIVFSPIGLHNYNGDACPVQADLSAVGDNAQGPGKWISDTIRNSSVVDVLDPKYIGVRTNGLQAVRAARDAAEYFCGAVDVAKNDFCSYAGIAPSLGDGSALHLLDGGLIDNLGIQSTLALDDRSDLAPGLFNRLVDPPKEWCGIQRILYVVVNSRSRDNAAIDSSVYPPSLISSAGYLVDTSLDSTILATQNYLTAEFQAINLRRGNSNFRNCPNDAAPTGHGENSQRKALDVKIVSVDFDMLTDAKCRQKFASIHATWGLEQGDAAALEELPAYLLERSEELSEFYGLFAPKKSREPQAVSGQPEPRAVWARFMHQKLRALDGDEACSTVVGSR